MTRETPYPQKRQPAKRIALKKHESIVSLLEEKIANRDKAITSLGQKLQTLTMQRDNEKLERSKDVERLEMRVCSMKAQMDTQKAVNEAHKHARERDWKIINRLVNWTDPQEG